MGFKSIRNPYNTTFKQHIVAALYHDIYIFSETHCLNNETVDFDSYTIYKNNRIPHTNVTKGSGGIAIAIHSSLLQCHTILSVFQGIDGQLAIKMKCNISEIVIGILGLYLSPDSYRYGQDAEDFFNQASALWQDLSDCDLTIGGGDLNSRTGSMIDYIPEIDGQIIPKRTNPDKNKNAHANSFITFLKDNRSLILNGRITPEYNNYTFVSTRGCSVPDYLFCPVDNLYNCTEMKTILVTDIINSFGLLPPKSIPDHSLLSGTFVTSDFDIGKNFENTNETEIDPSNSFPPKNKPPRKNLSKIDETFFMSQKTLELILSTIAKLENIVDTKDEINLLWAEVKNIFLAEMNNLPDKPSSTFKKQKRKFRKSKPFWNDELENLWSISCKSEKTYVNFRVNTNAEFPHKNMLRLDFKTAQKNFDKKYRYFKRQHHKNQYYDLETNATKQPAAMWATLKRLSNPPTARAALEIIREDKTISRDLKEILERWYKDISGLFSGLHDDPEIAFNQEFYEEVLKKKNEFEEMPFEEQTSHGNYDTEEMNSEISYDEVADAINNSKFKNHI